MRCACLLSAANLSLITTCTATITSLFPPPQTELAFKKLGVEPIVMSAGELESETAGQPGRLIRERYRKAAELSKTRGKLSCLVINDLDAGIGRFGNTQVRPAETCAGHSGATPYAGCRAGVGAGMCSLCVM
jgi:hypothetical protein